ncbi:MAG: peptidase C1 [Legionella sp.]|nr:MAG: peptidase C1 [Legionella sp.]
MKLINTLFALTLTVFTFKPAFAEGIEIIGSIDHHLKLKKPQQSLLNSKQATDKVIKLLQVQLSEEEKELLVRRAKAIQEHKGQFSVKTLLADPYTPAKVQLGMNNVPVLDQGSHGTCTTFAITGALDAVIGQGDYISQLCNLQLGTYLENHGYGSSGWDGAYGYKVIGQIQQFGVINTTKQHSSGCGGLKDYPTRSAHDNTLFMEPQQFAALSELIFGKVANWRNIPSHNINEVKQALNAGDRLVFATLLPRTDLGMTGAVGKYKTWIDKDSWVLTSEIIKAAPTTQSAHEMIIVGYDDNAVAVDEQGKPHKGLLTLRNSWGDWAGNNGEFYMSYDYFQLLSFDVIRISKFPN